MEWRTRVTELLGSKYPIIQGAYGGFGTSAIAGPVSEAGGFGIITAGALRTPDKLREDIRKAKAMTKNPFGVNISIGLAAYPEEMLDVIIDEGVPVLFTAAYRADDLGKRAQAAGMKWIHKVATIKHAVAAERQGADAVVIVGIEGTGFKSAIQLPTLITITKAVRLIKTIPVIAAGGIGDAKGFMAALGMGAEAVYLATAFMATAECPISKRYKQTLVDGEPWDPEIRDRALAPPKPSELERVLKERGNRPLGEWLRSLERVMLKQDADAPEPTPDWAREYDDEDYEEGLRISGGSMAVGVIEGVVTCKELIDSIIQGSEGAIASGKMGALSAANLGRVTPMVS